MIDSKDGYLFVKREAETQEDKDGVSVRLKKLTLLHPFSPLGTKWPLFPPSCVSTQKYNHGCKTPIMYAF